MLESRDESVESNATRTKERVDRRPEPDGVASPKVRSVETLESRDESVELSAIRREEYAILRQLIDGLNSRDRTFLIRYHVEGQSYEEIAADFGMTVNAVKVARHRAAARLSEMLQVQARNEHD